MDDLSISEDNMTWYKDHEDAVVSPTTTSSTIVWPNSQRGQSFDIDLQERANTKRKKYRYESDSTFQLALQYFNKRWQKPVNRNKKPGRREEQEIYLERINYFNTNATKIIRCRRCKDEVNGHRYYVNENKASDILCNGCMARKLKKEVGTNATRLQEELKWLGERDLDKKYSHQWSFKY